MQKKFEVIRIGVGAIMTKQDYAVADLTFLVVSREGRVGKVVNQGNGSLGKDFESCHHGIS